MTYTVTNTGNVRLKAHQKLHVEGLFGVADTTATLADLPELLPGASLTRTVSTTGVWPTTRMRAQIALIPFASEEIPPVVTTQVSATAASWAWPWGQGIALIILVLVIFIGLGAQRARRRRAVDSAIAAAVATALDEKPAKDSRS